MSEHKHPKKPVPMPDVTPEEIAAWKSGVIGKIEGMSVVRIDKPITPTLYKPNRAMRRNKND